MGTLLPLQKALPQTSFKYGPLHSTLNTYMHTAYPRHFSNQKPLILPQVLPQVKSYLIGSSLLFYFPYKSEVCSLNSEQQEQKQGHAQFITQVAMASLLRLVKLVSISMLGEWSFCPYGFNTEDFRHWPLNLIWQWRSSFRALTHSLACHVCLIIPLYSSGPASLLSLRLWLTWRLKKTLPPVNVRYVSIHLSFSPTLLS